MSLPRKGILIRLILWPPAIAFCAWHAWQKVSAENREPAPAPTSAQTQERLDAHRKSFTLPDGEVIEVPVLSPEEARSILGVDVEASSPPPEPNDDPPPTK